MIRLAGPGSQAAHYAVVSTADVKAFLQIVSTADDALIGYLVDGANRQLYTELGARFVLETGVAYDDVLDSDGSQKLRLLARPIVSVTSVAYVIPAGNGAVTTQETYVASDYQILADEGGLLRFSSGFPGVWPYGANCIRVVYRAGYATVPRDLVNAVCGWIGVTFQRLKNRRLDLVSYGKGEESFSYSLDPIPRSIARVFDMYRYWEATLA